MPILKIQTNKPIGEKEPFMLKATQLVSELLQKPVKYVMITCEETTMSFAGDLSPSLYAELKSIGFPEDQTTELSDALCRFFEEHLDIPGERIYIAFTNTARNLLGWDRKTFAS